jgi:hypothetical protein
MTDQALDSVLRLVAEGRLTADEAGPILDALQPSIEPPNEAPETVRHVIGDVVPPPSRNGGSGRALRIEVAERGRKVVNLRVPLALGRSALTHIPGLSESTAERIREALDSGIGGNILEVDDDGDGVRIYVE